VSSEPFDPFDSAQGRQAHYKLGLFWWGGERGFGEGVRSKEIRGKKQESGFVAREAEGKLGLFWVCFHQVSNRLYFHNPLLLMSLSSFLVFGNWVCFA